MRLAFVFPGQGSQSVGMLNGFSGNAVVEDYVRRADAALGFPISKLIAEGPAEELGLTVNTQPALLTASVAFYEAWLAAGGMKPEVMAGHSLGEYSALPCASHAERRSGGRWRHVRRDRPLGRGCSGMLQRSF